jgi:hypothetical protein
MGNTQVVSIRLSNTQYKVIEKIVEKSGLDRNTVIKTILTLALMKLNEREILGVLELIKKRRSQ